MSMKNLTPPIAASLVRISPNSKYIACIQNGSKCIVIDASTQQPIRTINYHDKIDDCMFSQDSDRVLCLLKERNVVQAFSISDQDWKCRINEGKFIIIIILFYY